MTQQQQHPMQPTDEQLAKWLNCDIGQLPHLPFMHDKLMAAYQAGADDQLEKDIKWVSSFYQFGSLYARKLSIAMRPAPPTLRELRDAALEALERHDPISAPLIQRSKASIRAALEAMPVEPESEARP